MCENSRVIRELKDGNVMADANSAMRDVNKPSDQETEN